MSVHLRLCDYLGMCLKISFELFGIYMSENIPSHGMLEGAFSEWSQLTAIA